MATNLLYPSLTKQDLQKVFVGKSIKDVPAPAVVLDISKVKRNCDDMLQAVHDLGFSWRAHIKTHKTTELTSLQVGPGPEPVRIIVSTVLEAENVLPLLQTYQASGRTVNLLYGLPLAPSAVPRLAAVLKILGPNSLSVFIDNIAQLPGLIQIHKLSGFAPNVYIKIDMGYHRAGILPDSEEALGVIASILEVELQKHAVFTGLYAHAGHSYSGSSRATALDYLRQEFEALLVMAEAVRTLAPQKKLVLSVGATPSTTSVRNMLVPETETPEDASNAIHALKATVQRIRDDECSVELHAGVYPVLDVQQLATHALPDSMRSWDDVAISVVVEVVSVYPGRGKDGRPEALIAAGSMALGREPCKAYPGWGIVSNWNIPSAVKTVGSPEKHAGWQVGRISQEHGILTWNGDVGAEDNLEIGQKLRIWPNHACVAGAGYGWYLIVDSSVEGKEDEIVDVWPRWRGW